MMVSATPGERFGTTDLSVAAFLLSTGVPLQGIEPLNGQRKVFLFPAEGRDAAEAYYQNATVPARAFASALRDLKALALQRG